MARIVAQQNVVVRVVVARIAVQQSVVGSAVVARAAVEPNWDLHISPARSGKRGPMSQRGSSFGTNIEGLVLVSLAYFGAPVARLGHVREQQSEPCGEETIVFCSTEV